MSSLVLPLLLLLVFVCVGAQFLTCAEPTCTNCTDGWWGDRCLSQCPPSDARCVRCDKTTGICECSPGGYGKACNCADAACVQCHPGFWAANCTQRCNFPINPNSNCNTDAGCLRTNGQVCAACKSGSWGAVCEQRCRCSDPIRPCDAFNGECLCTGNSFGVACSQKCDGCLSSPNPTLQSACPLLGLCQFGCKPGRVGLRCDKSCSRSCAPDPSAPASLTRCDRNGACLFGCATNTTWGTQCEKSCSASCVGGCNATTGHCVACGTDLIGDFCEIDCRRCIGGTCDANGCTGTCTESFFGKSCERSCGFNCAQCDRVAGCTSCLPGFFGPSCGSGCGANCGACDMVMGCTACTAGFYGRRCDLPCGEGCEGTCDETGNCAACKPGWRSGRPTAAPMTCDVRCSSTCAFAPGTAVRPCGDSGTCTHGCVELRSGAACDVPCHQDCSACSQSHACDRCPTGKYGARCEWSCPKCSGGACQRDTGRCTEPCDDGWWGDQCDRKVTKGCVSATQDDGRCVQFAATGSPSSTTSGSVRDPFPREAQTALMVLALVVGVILVCAALCYGSKKHADRQAKRMAALSPDQLLAILAIGRRQQTAADEWDRGAVEREFERELNNMTNANNAGKPYEPQLQPEDREFIATAKERMQAQAQA